MGHLETQIGWISQLITLHYYLMLYNIEIVKYRRFSITPLASLRKCILDCFSTAFPNKRISILSDASQKHQNNFNTVV